MSRFWGGGSDSESEDEVLSKSEESEEENSEESEEEQEGGGFFDRMDSDEDEPEVKRVVRSQKDKRNEAINNAIKSIKNALKINDWVATQDEFDNLLKVVQKATSGADKMKTPRSFIRCMVRIEDSLEGAWSTKDKKKMSANNQKSMSSMKQRLRKEKQKYEKEMEQFRQSPVDTEQSEEERNNEQEAGEEEKEEKEAEPELTADDIDRVIQEVISSRGKKNVNRKKQIETLKTLKELAEQAIDEVKILLAIVTLRLDQVTGMASHMPTSSWRHAHAELNLILDILEKNEDLLVTTEVEDTADETSESYQKVAKRGKRPIAGSLVAIIERLDDEFTKSLQNIDSHTTEYIERLRDANELYHLAVRTQLYYEKSVGEESDPNSLCRIMIRRVEHIYYKNDSINNALEKKVLEKIKGSAEEVDSSALVHRLCSFLYKHGDERIKTRALLCEVYHHALHGRYFKARDLLLMSHLQEFIQNAEVGTKVLFNRAMVQTGLCAFRHGMLKESQAALQDIISTGRSKELLAQGMIIQKGIEKTSEQEKLEKQRQVPFHMHINLELLECIFLTCSMILEVPFMAASSYEARKRIVSKALRRVLDQSERQIFSGPPENTREHIMHATKALMGGDWEKCIRLIHAIKIWDLMPQVDNIKQMLSTKIQQAGIQTYLLSYGNFYETISLDQLSQMFKLRPSEVHAIVSRMIVNEELHASLDQVTGVAVIHRVEPTKLQYLSLQFTEKAQTLIEINEKILEIRTGNLGGRDDKQQGQQQGQNPNKYGSKPMGRQQGQYQYPRQNNNNPNQNKRQNNPPYRNQFQNQFRPRYQGADEGKAE